MNRSRRTGVVAVAALLLGGVAACTSSSPTAPAAAIPAPAPTGSSGTAPAGAPGASGESAAGAATPQVRVTESNPPGDIPDNQAYVPYRPAGAPVSVKVPEGWARSVTGSTTTFSDKLNRIEIVTSKAAAAPTTTAVTSQDVARLQGAAPSFSLGKVSTVNPPAGNAVLLTYRVDSAPDQVTGKVVRDAVERYTFYRSGSRVDLSLIGPVNADNVDPWKIVSNSVVWQ